MLIIADYSVFFCSGEDYNKTTTMLSYLLINYLVTEFDNDGHKP